MNRNAFLLSILGLTFLDGNLMAQNPLNSSEAAPIGIEPIETENGAKSKRLASSKSKIDVVFVLDTTGSMSGLIHAAKEKIWAIANTIAKAEGSPAIRIGLVGYRDRGDQYVTIQTPLSIDLDSVYTKLMEYRADGGKDTPESVNEGLHRAVETMDWESGEDVYRVVFLVGDAPPHMDYDDDIKYAESCRLALKKKIFINTIQCGAIQETTPIWKEIAELASGRYASIPQSGGVVLPESPFDKEIAELSVQMDATRVFYGNFLQKSEQTQRSANAGIIYADASLQSIAQRAAFNTCPSGMANFCGGQELVSDVTEGRVKIEDLQKTLLPDNIRELSLEKLKSHIYEKLGERNRHQSQIIKLTEKRQSWLAEELAKTGKERPEIDRIIFETIQLQASKSGIRFGDAVPSL
jgi:Mg-chelatase subunit ChlD